MTDETFTVLEQPTRARRVLVTGAGGAAGVAVIRSLRTGSLIHGATHHVTATDCDPHAAGLALAHHGFVSPPASSPSFARTLIQRCRSYRIEALVTTVAEEIEALRAAAHELEAIGTRLWLPPSETTSICNDKLAFFHRLHEQGVPTPATIASPSASCAEAIAEAVPGPWIVKPREGRGSRDVFAADSIDDLRYALPRVQEPIVQTRLTGREFTVDVLVSRRRDLIGVSPRWRLATKGGISTSGVTFRHPEVQLLVEQTMHALQYEGVGCLQGFLDDEGRASCVEVNPRFGGGVSLSIAAGAAFAHEFVALTIGESLTGTSLVAQPGVRMTRFFDEVVTDTREPAQLCA